MRASATADAITGDRCRLPDESGLRELHFGEWELKCHSEINAADPKLLTAYLNSPGNVCPPGGESWNDAAARVSHSIDRIQAEHSGADIIIVSHFGAILTQVQRALGISPKQAWSHRIENLSVTRIIRDDEWKVCSINQHP